MLPNVILTLVLLGPTFYVGMRLGGGLLSVPGMVSGFWFFSTLLPLLGIPDGYVNARTIVLITGLVATFLAGFYLTTKANGRRDIDEVDEGFFVAKTPLRVLVGAGTLCGLGATALAASAQGLSLPSLLSFETLVAMATESSIARYSGDSPDPGVIPLLLAVSYAGSILAPQLLLGRSHLLWRVASFGPSLALTGFSLATTARLPMLLSFFFYAGGLIAFQMAKQGHIPLLSRKIVIWAAAAAGFLCVMFIGAAFLRIGAPSGATEIVLHKARTYAFGYLAGLSVWLEAWLTTPDRTLALGTASVAGVSVLTGIPVEVTRGYNYFLQLTPAGDVSNVSTAVRPLLIDFGVPGTLLLMGTIGLILGHLQHSLLTRGKPTTTVLVGAFLGLLFMSQTNVMLTYTNVAIGILCAYGFARVFIAKSNAACR